MQNNLTSKYREILDYISRKKSATVAELTSVFYLSESTVRRLLAEMDRNGLVERFHGGAVLAGEHPHEKVMVFRGVQNIQEKAAIGREAASHVRDGMTLLLLGGTTVLALCPYIRGRSVTVITTSIPVINELQYEEGMKLILLGGTFNPAELEVRGALTVNGLERLRADVLFIGATNIHPLHGLMTSDPEAVQTYRTCLAVSDRKILLADSSKFKTGGVTVVASLDELDALITDEGLQKESVEMLGRLKIAVTAVKLKEQGD